MKENTWLPDTEWNPHEDPTVPEFVGTDIRPDEDGGVVVERAQDVEPILERCKELARSNTFRSASNEMHHLADFPMVEVEKYMARRGVTWEEFLNNKEHIAHMLSDPELRDFLVAANATHRVWR